METKLGQEPAFPVENKHVFNPKYNGMSKRFYAACAAMQGLLSIPSPIAMDENTIHNEIKLCYAYADELLKQESE